MSNLHPAGTSPTTNRLAGEASPYLQQHAKNPVDWFPWGPEALAKAAKEDRPILLSIGYSACHWCHVMERESFEDAAIAAQMNESFVSIKVDREERPDLDQIYQLVVQLMGRNGGWPLTVFLTPDQKPFFGGTYFPPVDRYGMPGFSKILAAVSDAYRARRDEVDAQAKELTAAIASVTAVEKTRGDAYAPGPDLLERAVQKLSARFDDQNGGLGTRPKFPNTMALDVFLRRGALEGDSRSLARTKLALDRMRGGGIYDQLGHGFHRYSTDERWLVPHFEKMLYDNALLLRLYTDAFRATEEPRFAATARAIAAYVAREMTDVDGGFYATQDADSEGEEGRFFVWSPAEIDAALAGDEEAAAVAKLHWGVTAEGNFEQSGKTVLHVARPVVDLAAHLGKAPSAIEDAIERARRKLFAVREARPRPFRDEKILVSWNGLMIGALADAGAALGQPALVAMADRAFRFLEARLVSGEGAATRVERHCMGGVVKGPGFLDDYAFLADAALDLFEATGDAHHVTRARGLADAILARFGDATDGGFFFTPEGGEALIHRAKDPFDHAIPSGASMACKALLRLSVLVDARYAEAATRQLESIAAAAVDNPFGFGQTLGVLDRLVRGSVDVVIAGDRLDPSARALHDVALHAYLPNRNLAWLRDADARAACALLADGKPPGKDGAVAYVCRGRTCSLPLSTPESLRAELTRRPARG